MAEEAKASGALVPAREGSALRSRYGDAAIDEFCAAACRIGIGPAMRELGYPKSYATGSHWCAVRGLNPTKERLAAMFANRKHMLDDEQRIEALHLAIDRAVDQLDRDDLTAGDVRQLTAAMQSAVETIRLLEGQSTARVEMTGDPELVSLVAQARARSAEVEEAIVLKAVG